ncbi:MAG: threonylcarbamoyl-AMP synthase [Methylacidiphilales bacterium]|nr:threonylcarbamoyl-AMP synthase [Candidatus Methylacidiphilales bacterium]
MNDSNCFIPAESIKPEPPLGEQANNVVTATPKAVSRAAQLLRRGQVIGLPTETVYGLAGDGLNPAALARIFEIKQRPLFDPLILHFADANSAFLLAANVPDTARELARRFWPGPLTLVLPKKDVVPDLATSGLPTVALRVPVHPVAQAVLRAFSGPLAAPSANRFGRISPTDAPAVSAELGAAVPLILDGGPCLVGVESTVLDLSGEKPVLLRAGGVTIEQLEAVTGPVGRTRAVDERPLAPGQLRHHYAPRKPLRLVRGAEEIPQRADAGRLAFGATPAVFAGVTKNLSPDGDLGEAAANFFRLLRALDDDPRVTELYAIRLPSRSLGLAINERLERAATSSAGGLSASAAQPE